MSIKRLLLILFLLCSILRQTEIFAQNSDSLRSKYKKSDLYKETEKKMSGGLNADSITIPDSLSLPPLHFVDGYVTMDSIKNFSSLSIDIDIKNDVPDWYKLYISPFTLSINRMLFYCGLQTHSGGKKYPDGKKDEELGRGAIFSRWYERSKNALQTQGYYASSDNEGDFISVRNKYKWHKGKYRIVLYKDGYVSGKPVSISDSLNTLMFSFGEYEQTWVAMKVIDLQTNKEKVIGKLAFPGKVLNTDYYFAYFIENYGHTINYSDSLSSKILKDKRNKKSHLAINYKELPLLNISFSNLMVDNKTRHLVLSPEVYNGTQHPFQNKIKMPLPRMAEVKFDSANQVINITTGKLFHWNKTKIDEYK